MYLVLFNIYVKYYINRSELDRCRGLFPLTSVFLSIIAQIFSILLLMIVINAFPPFSPIFSPYFRNYHLPSFYMIQTQKSMQYNSRVVKPKPIMNESIEYHLLRVTVSNLSKRREISELGILCKLDALATAEKLGNLDLILINEHSNPPVAKITEYSKYRYEKNRKYKEYKKNSKSSEMKEVKMSYKINTHDFRLRIKNISKFIQKGSRVKITVQFRGREVQHRLIGVGLLNRLVEDITKICYIESKPKLEGKNLRCILSPKPEIIRLSIKKRKSNEK